MKIATYSRVSRNDGTQDASNQADELRAWAERLGGTIVKEYIDKVSGTKSADARPGLAQALQDPHERRYEVLLIWSLDRHSRGGVLALTGILERVQRSGVVLKSYREPWLDTWSPASTELLVSIFGWIARQEREQLIARTKAGMARAKRRGVHVGRPRVENEGTVRNRLTAEGTSLALPARC